MDTLNNLLDNARKLCSPSTDAALAVKLGVSRSAVSLWRKGGQITEKHLTALIDFAKADARLAVTVLAEQATTKQERSVWGALAKQLGAAAMLAFVALLPGFAQASVLQPEQSQVICIMRNEWARKLARALRFIRTFVTERSHGTSPVLA